MATERHRKTGKCTSRTITGCVSFTHVYLPIYSSEFNSHLILSIRRNTTNEVLSLSVSQIPKGTLVYTFKISVSHSFKKLDKETRIHTMQSHLHQTLKSDTAGTRLL